MPRTTAWEYSFLRAEMIPAPSTQLRAGFFPDLLTLTDICPKGSLSKDLDERSFSEYL